MFIGIDVATVALDRSRPGHPALATRQEVRTTHIEVNRRET